MDRPDLITICGAADDLLGSCRTTALVLAVLLAAIGGALLFCFPIPTHAVRVDLAEPGPQRSGPRHILRVDQSGTIILDGVLCPGPVGLRAALEPIAVERDAVIEVRPHREARYEVFLEVLAFLRFVDAAHVRLVYEPPDDEPGEAPYRRAPDEYGGYGTDTSP